MTRVGGDFRGEQVELSQITVEVEDVKDVDAAAAIIEMLLQKYHDKEDYAVVVPKELLRQAERTRAMFNVLLIVIRRHIAVRGRHWHHEHHAGNSDGTHSGDRYPTRSGR